MASKRDGSGSAYFESLYGEPELEEQRLVTSLMRAANALAETLLPQYLTDPPPTPARPDADQSVGETPSPADLLPLLSLIRTYLDQHPKLNALLAPLPEAFGDGDLLQVVFRNLFPTSPASKALDAEGKPFLSRRQVEVLREASGDRSHEEIAERLGISKDMVDKHFKNIYKRLEVHRPLQAVARAVSMGYLELDAIEFIRQAGRTAPRDFALLNCLLSYGGFPDPPHATALQSLAQFALFLLILCGQAGHRIRSVEWILNESSRSLICELDAEWRILQRFGGEHLHYYALDIAVAPPHAARHGFTPGHLFVAREHIVPHSLNVGAVAEFSPDGRFVRSFCGSNEIGTRLISCNSLAFDSDGRLLVTSGFLTDAILAFTENGAHVRRIARRCVAQLCIHSSGLIYAPQVSETGYIICILDADGNLVRTFGSTPAGLSYGGIAVTSQGHVFVTRNSKSKNELEEFDLDGRSLRFLEIPRCEGKLRLDAQERLYILCPGAGVIQILSCSGKQTGSINLRGVMKPLSIAFGPDGRRWVVGLS